MKNNKGFSLVELIVVIAIMAILAAVAVASFSIYIDRANDAADFEYLSNLTYFAELFAIENQLGLDSVVVSEHGVKGPEDIGLWVIVPGQEEKGPQLMTGEKIREIYDGVGDWEFKGEGFKDEIESMPENKEDMDESNNGDGSCEQDTDHEYSEITKVDSTCKRAGYIKYKCSKCGKENIQELPLGEHDYPDTPTYQKGKYSYYVCETEGCNQIKIMSSDGSVIVPIN